MAEFCLECFNKMNHTNYTKRGIWLEYDLCEGCAEWKPCVIELRPKPILYRIADGIEDLYYRLKKDEE